MVEPTANATDGDDSEGETFSAFQEVRREVLRLRIAYVHLYKQYLDLDDEYHKLTRGKWDSD